VSGFTVLGGVGWNLNSMGVGLLTGADSFGADSSINGASLTGTDLEINGGGALLEAFISSIEISKGPAKTEVLNPKTMAVNILFMAE